MTRILRFDRGRRGLPWGADSSKVWDYVLPRLGFPLPGFIMCEIEQLISDIWSSAECEINFYECVDALDGLARHSIMIPPARREKIVELIFEYLRENGSLYETE